MEFSIVVTVKVLGGVPKGYPQMIRDGMYNAIVNYAESFPEEVSVTISDDHGEVVIGELCEAIREALEFLMSKARRDPTERRIISLLSDTLYKYALPAEEK